jgi:hypothetical protein
MYERRLSRYGYPIGMSDLLMMPQLGYDLSCSLHNRIWSVGHLFGLDFAPRRGPPPLSRNLLNQTPFPQ